MPGIESAAAKRAAPARSARATTVVRRIDRFLRVGWMVTARKLARRSLRREENRMRTHVVAFG
jgi:hypothetical protein